MIDYGQFCTVARGAEVLGELWTPLVVRELLCGSRRFNDIHRGVPRMSATLLTQRLRKLEEIGVVERRRGRRRLGVPPHAGGRGAAARSSSASATGARAGSAAACKREQLDAGFLMWDIRRFARIDEFPARPARGDPLPLHAMRRAASGAGGWWSRTASADLCRDDPGHEVDGDRRLDGARADRGLDRRQRSRRREIARGPSAACRARAAAAQTLWRWLGRSLFAPTRIAARAA